MRARDAATGAVLDPSFELVPLDGGSGDEPEWGGPGDEDWLFVEPGRYRLIADTPWGYAPIEPVDVVVERDRMTPVELVFESADVKARD